MFNESHYVLLQLCSKDFIDAITNMSVKEQFSKVCIQLMFTKLFYVYSIYVKIEREREREREREMDFV